MVTTRVPGRSAAPALLQEFRASGTFLWFSDSPQLPGLALPLHQALVFSIGAGGSLPVRYVT